MLKLAHRLCFGTTGKKLTVKKELRKFNGFADADASFESKKKAVMSKCALHDLTDVAKLLDARGAEKGVKEDVVKALYDFLVKPEPSSGEGLEPGKRSKSKSSKKKGKGGSKKKDGEKRPPNPYMTFAAEMRKTVMKENPEMKMTEVAKELGVRWRALSDKEKAKYKGKAGPSPAKKQKTKKSKDEGDETSDESEEEDLGLESKLRAAISAILKERSQQEQVSSKEVRKTLKETFGDVIDDKKDRVKALIREEYDKMDQE
eukprot:gb/GEZN01008238.1/.p1 GENE.gb/GEZN01008238.1/~~gb/GEZN01008238.1/.p1  ORF type:complete len:260 (+),score=87.34 gb/GEZN01008238.1/:360-1139(+)